MKYRYILLTMISVLLGASAMAQDIASAGCCDVQSVTVDDSGRIWIACGLYEPEQQSGLGLIAPGTECSSVAVYMSTTMGQMWTEVRQASDCRRITLWNVPGKGVRAILSDADGISVSSWNEGWQPAVKVGEGVCTYPPVYAGGVWYMPVSLGGSVAAVYRSSDGGETWTMREGRLTVPEKTPSDIQPCAVAGKDGGLVLYTRSNGTAWSFTSVSSDGGTNWTSPARFLPNPDREFSVTRLADGRLLLLRNGRLDQCLYILPEGLYAYLSDDDGQTWYGGLRLDARAFSERPHAAVYPNGRISIFFCHNSKGKNQICMAMTGVDEIDAASGSFKTAPRVAVPVMAAGKGAQTWQERFSKLTESKSSWAAKPLRVATYNIQYPASKAPKWKNERVPALKAVFEEYGFDVVGSQEPWKYQMDDLMAALGDDFAYVSTNRNNDPAAPKAHYNPIIYRKSRVELLEWGTFWYTDVPGTPGYGAFSSRFCTWARFLDKATGKKFCHFNSHFDHLGLEIRVYSSFILTDKIAEISDGLPTFCTGDFNSDEKTRCYKEILACGFLADPMADAPEVFDKDVNSMHNYKEVEKNRRDGRHIDHLFYTPSNSRPLRWQVILDGNTAVGSDHLPVYMDWLIAD